MVPDGEDAKKKTTTLTQLDKQGDSGRRLVEYFVVVSSIERARDDATKDGPNADVPFSEWKTESSAYDDEDEFAHYYFRPTITARYPLEDHPDNPLHENVTFFCHPSGSITVRVEEHMPKVHYFVATGGTGKQIYGTCLTLWEPYDLKVWRPGQEENKGTGNEIRKVFLPKCLVILSTYPYLAAFREYLTQLNRLSKLGEMTLPVERYVLNFCAEIPAPPPGSFEVQTTILDSVIKIWSPPHNLPITWVSLPFSHLFECLDLDNIVLVWHCLVLERQVLITSTQLSILTTATEIFLSLLFPMRWSHAYIPLLPHFLIPILSAPMPFLCGIHKANLADALFDLSRECVLVDLDKNTVTLGPDTTPLPPLPPNQERSLHSMLEENVGMIFREARSLTKNDDYSDSGANLPPHVKLMAEAMWESKLCLFDEAFHLLFTPEESRKNLLNGNDASGLDSERDLSHPMSLLGGGDKQTGRKQSQWDAVQEAFLDTFVYLLRNYRKFLVFPSKHNEGAYGGAGFRSKEFIESQRYDMREFLEQFIGTQMFDNFITKRLYGSGEADVAFFDMAVDRFLKNAGIFADLDFSGRILDVSGFKSSEKRVVQRGVRPRKSGSTYVKRNEDPLIQSASVHRKLKTIVPPEPTGEGLALDSSHFVNGVVVIADDTVDDDSSVQSAGSKKAKQGNLTIASDIMRKSNVTKFKYPVFPSELNPEFFGVPRPLSAAVIAEFDRQRKDAAQFKRKGLRVPKDAKKHIHRVHSAVDPANPPSAEVSTFTVFFMAFTALVGKELIEVSNQISLEDRPILSTYVPTTAADSDTEGGSESGDSQGLERIEEQKDTAGDVEGVAQMKTSRPAMHGMFGDEDETDDLVSLEDDENLVKDGFYGNDIRDIKPDAHVDVSSNGGPPVLASRLAVDNSDSKTTRSDDDSQPRSRFRDKLSDLQIEEARATGQAQLALAFEILTMMKKRALKADPEAYQCLIDACGRVGDTKRATDLLAKMHEDGIVADGTVYACLVSAFSADTAWKRRGEEEDLPEWANSTAVEMDWNKLQKRSLLDRVIGQVVDLDDEEDADEEDEELTAYQKLRKRWLARRRQEAGTSSASGAEDSRMEFYVTEAVDRQIALGENLLEIVFPDISVDTENETCPRCNFLLSDDDVVNGWSSGDPNDYTTACPNCTQRFVPHFCVQCSSPSFRGSKGPASPLLCERLSPWVLQKEIRSVMSDDNGASNLLNPKWREEEYKNSVLWWNLVLSYMRYRLPFSFLLQGSFEQNLIAPMPETEG